MKAQTRSHTSNRACQKNNNNNNKKTKRGELSRFRLMSAFYPLPVLSVRTLMMTDVTSANSVILRGDRGERKQEQNNATHHPLWARNKSNYQLYYS